MPPLSIEERVAALEQKVESLSSDDAPAGKRKKDWRRTIGMFTNDPGMQELFADAMKLREADRRKAKTKKRQAKT